MLLACICEKHFVGQADRIKEYNIAVEALGRSPDFDTLRLRVADVGLSAI